MNREEAIEKVRQMSLPKETMEILEALAPELRESEDERIRKDIIGGLMWQRDNLKSEDPHDNNLILPGFCFTVGKHLAYLEKQKEQKPMDKIDLKFNIGDTIVNKKNGEKCTISNRSLLHQYYSDTNHCHEIKFDEQDDWELVKEQKPDNLDESEKVAAAYQLGRSDERKQKEQKPAECVADSIKFDEGFKTGREVGFREGFESVKSAELTPLATLLSNYLKNDFEYFATKKWDEKKWNEVMNIQASELLRTAKNELEQEQKPAWSEEDEEIFNNIIEKAKGGHWIEVNEIIWLINRFKSPHPSWKPSEEQMDGLLVAIGDEKERGSDVAKTLRSLYEQLKKL